MQKPQNYLVPFLDYIPAELRINKEWIIVYSVKSPATGKLQRIRKRVPKYKPALQRKRIATKITTKINENLALGWNPILENEAPNSLTLLMDSIEHFQKSLELDFKNNAIRKDTLRSYASIMKIFADWVRSKNENEFVYNFKSEMVSNFLDYVYFERKVSARTYNNYLLTLRLFANYLIQKSYIKSNPTEIFKKKKNQLKKRTVIEKPAIDTIFEELKEVNAEYLLLCKLIYFCYIRPTEISKLKVHNIKLNEGLIYLSPEISKKTHGFVTIPKPVIQDLAFHLRKANMQDYLFSKNDCKAGVIQSNGKAYYDLWQKYVIKKKLTDNPLYSLKDSGITFALDSGVSPVSVMNQARHSDLTITTTYIRKSQTKADSTITNANW